MILGMDICPSDLVRSDEMSVLDPTNEYRHILIMSKSYSRLIHDPQILVESLFEREYFIVHSIRMFLGILVIYTIYLGGLHYTVTLELESS